MNFFKLLRLFRVSAFEVSDLKTRWPMFCFADTLYRISPLSLMVTRPERTPD